jgi:hypothetical protein
MVLSPPIPPEHAQDFSAVLSGTVQDLPIAGQESDEGPPQSQRRVGRVFPVSSPLWLSAPVSGEILFVGPLRGWGATVFIEVAPERILVMSGFSEVQVKEFQRITRGQTLGKVTEKLNVSTRFRDQETDLSTVLPLDQQENFPAW